MRTTPSPHLKASLPISRISKMKTWVVVAILKRLRTPFLARSPLVSNCALTPISVSLWSFPLRSSNWSPFFLTESEREVDLMARTTLADTVQDKDDRELFQWPDCQDGPLESIIQKPKPVRLKAARQKTPAKRVEVDGVNSYPGKVTSKDLFLPTAR